MTRLPRPKVADPIIFRPTPTSTDRVVRPCSGKHREYWLGGYIVASCNKCCTTLVELTEATGETPMTAELVAKARYAALRAAFFHSGEAELFTALADAAANTEIDRLRMALTEAQKR